MGCLSQAYKLRSGFYDNMRPELEKEYGDNLRRYEEYLERQQERDLYAATVFAKEEEQNKIRKAKEMEEKILKIQKIRQRKNPLRE